MRKASSPLLGTPRRLGPLPPWLFLYEPIGIKARRILFSLDPGEVAGLAFVLTALVADLVVGGPVLDFLVRLILGGCIIALAWLGVRALLGHHLRRTVVPEALRTLRSCVALTMSFAVYMALPPVIDYVQPVLWDEALHALEVAMLQSFTGGVPLYRVLQGLSTPELTTWFSIAYSLQMPFYYLTGTVLALQQQFVAARSVFLIMTLTQYVGFVGYLVGPALGPGVYFASGSLAPSEQTIVAHVVATYGVARGTFPSLHAAISLVALLTTWIYLRRLVWLVAPLVISLWISTLYLRHHYLPDLLAGWALAAAMVVLAPRLRSWWEACYREVFSRRVGRLASDRPGRGRLRRPARLPSPAGGGSSGSPA